MPSNQFNVLISVVNVLFFGVHLTILGAIVLERSGVIVVVSDSFVNTMEKLRLASVTTWLIVTACYVAKLK